MALPVGGGDVAHVAAIHLCLLAGRSFQATHRHDQRRLSLRLQVTIEDAIASWVAALLYLLEQNYPVPDTGGQALFEVGLVRIQQGRSGLSWAIAGRAGLAQVFANGWSAVAGEGADLGNAEPLTFVVVNLVHL